MIRFAALFASIDATTKTNEKLSALVHYFRSASHADAALATFFLCGYKLRQLVPTKLLRVWAAEEANIPSWLFEESYHSVGDLAETLTLVLPPGEPSDDLSLSDWVENRLLPSRDMNDAEQRSAVVAIWNQSPTQMRLVWLKENPKRSEWNPKSPPPLRLLWITPLRALEADTENALRSPIEAMGLPWLLESRTGDSSQSLKAKKRMRLSSLIPAKMDRFPGSGHIGSRRWLDPIGLARTTQEHKPYPGEQQFVLRCFCEYDPTNLLLEQCRREVLEQQLEVTRLRGTLMRMEQARILVTRPPKVTPLAFSLIVDKLRERLSSETLAERVARMQFALEKAASESV